MPKRQAGIRGTEEGELFAHRALTTGAEQRLARVLFRTPVGYATGSRAVNV